MLPAALAACAGALYGADRRKAIDYRAFPKEIQCEILAWLVAPDAEAQAHDGLGSLTLSRTHYRALAPAAYHTLYIRSLSALHRLRHTLVLRRPGLAGYVRCVHLVQLPETAALGVEHLLLALPNLEELALDAPSCAVVCRSTADRLQGGAKPRRVRIAVPSTEAAMDVSGTLLTFAMLGRMHTLHVTAAPQAAVTLVQRLGACSAALKHLHLALDAPPSDALHDALAHLQAQRTLRISIEAA